MNNTENMVQHVHIIPILDEVEIDAERNVLQEMVKWWQVNTGFSARLGMRIRKRIELFSSCDDGSKECGGEEDAGGFFGDGAGDTKEGDVAGG